MKFAVGVHFKEISADVWVRGALKLVLTHPYRIYEFGNWSKGRAEWNLRLEYILKKYLQMCGLRGFKAGFNSPVQDLWIRHLVKRSGRTECKSLPWSASVFSTLSLLFTSFAGPREMTRNHLCPLCCFLFNYVLDYQIRGQRGCLRCCCSGREKILQASCM